MTTKLERSSIQILEKEPNRRGDLFGRLMEGLVLALGYDHVRLNIHKSGREIDIEAAHRTERRILIAECKAVEDAIGGDAINKFVGSLDAEKRKNSEAGTAGYFISLSGFTETAIQQEKELDNSRVVLLDSGDVVSHLITGRMIVRQEVAMERAGRCVASVGDALVPEEVCELLAHEIGWIWAIFFDQNKERTHFALVHADGNLIAPSLARKIVASDKIAGGRLHGLQYLHPPVDKTTSQEKVNKAKEKYLEYLARECGEIQLEGLPADQDLGSRRLKLERIFVPLHLTGPISAQQESSGLDLPKREGAIRNVPSRQRLARKGEVAGDEARLTVGKVIEHRPRLAILGLPGGGKSTLLKRLAIAYGFPDRRGLVDDGLPVRTWLPLFVRCRQLDGRTRASTMDILYEIAARAEMTDELAQAFKLLVSEALREGNALLLIDGLDEISSERDRLAFVFQLRTFLATYPTVAIIVTSREAGFRIIGGALSRQCDHFKLADFDELDVKRLTENWHKEVVGTSAQIRSDARKLAQTICSSSGLLALAANPLLLTTLLLVKRWVGQLPTKRTILYSKAIEVLLMTWNVEGHDPLDQDEVLPQLEYLAFTMMEEGIQTISLKKLHQVLLAARKQMPEILGWTKTSVTELVQRVELRSSLLMLSGHVIEDGVMQATYEFRHLTFQEYLVAKAIVEGHYPDRLQHPDILSVLEPHLEQDTWKEVIPLAAVLAGRQVEPLLRNLIEKGTAYLENTSPHGRTGRNLRKTPPTVLLASCLLDEIQASPDLLAAAMKCAVRDHDSEATFEGLRRTRYGDMLCDVAKEELRNSRSYIMSVGGNLVQMLHQEIGVEWGRIVTRPIVGKIDKLLCDVDPLIRALGCLIVMEVSYYSSRQGRLRGSRKLHPRRPILPSHKLVEWRNRLVQLSGSSEPYLEVSALWALDWLAPLTTWGSEEILTLTTDLVSRWMKSRVPDISYVTSWLISVLPMTERNAIQVRECVDITTFSKFVAEKIEKPSSQFDVSSALLSAYYLGAPWSEDALLDLAKKNKGQIHVIRHPKWVEEFAKLLKKRVAAGPPS